VFKYYGIGKIDLPLLRDTWLAQLKTQAHGEVFRRWDEAGRSHSWLLAAETSGIRSV